MFPSAQAPYELCSQLGVLAEGLQQGKDWSRVSKGYETRREGSLLKTMEVPETGTFAKANKVRTGIQGRVPNPRGAAM